MFKDGCVIIFRRIPRLTLLMQAKISVTPYGILAMCYLQQPHHIILVAQDVVHNGCGHPLLNRYTYVITDSKSARSLQTRCKQTTDTKKKIKPSLYKILTDLLYYHYYHYLFCVCVCVCVCGGGGGGGWFRCIWKSRTDSLKQLKLLSTM